MRTSRAARQRVRHHRVGKACDGLEALELVLHLLPDVAASPDAYDALTAWEREVLLLAALGLTNPEIGTRLGISRRTAETHHANLLRKLGLKGQQELIRYVLRRGLLEL